MVCAMMLGGWAVVRAEDKPAAAESTEKKADSEKKADASKVKVVQPWSKLTSLSDEQKTKIKEIHAKALDEEKAIKEKENADIMALLTDDQKKELKSMQEKETAEKKTKTAAKKDAPAEEPKSD